MDNIESIWDFDEDDLFYAELRKQVLLLTAEDDEESKENKFSNSVECLQQRLSISPASTLQQGCYFDWSANEATESVPTWLFNLWKSGNGTGVFIPQIVKARRTYNKPRRKNNYRGRMYKPVANVKS